ncbi:MULTISPECIES: hypothetical protein [Enterobacter]|uniref:hypothetical protein n=1 Tax=Enterobacter TaxID=547 RepID=UPI000FEC0C5E|nr:MULTISPECIES: hypothetical protein [Enterobacter]MCR1303006.1 hypothetical protein [Enterobacter sp. FL1277]MCR1307757.1 hypothetical protein [Enterobacter sp. BT1271]MCR1313769.1 hypothetical protein [Enterobacter sp. BT855]MCR1322185.1 hypothetical protein [Enterobacter sp. BT1268]MCR1326617.1 hypothetical protein [Enterobacter sp. BT1131]
MSRDLLLSTSFEHLLCCPHCKGTYLHQYKYEIFDRAEDAQEGNHVVVDGSDVTINRSMEGNPSARRDGLKIYFTCEGCEENPTLLITQHKGQTFLQFE